MFKIAKIYLAAVLAVALVGCAFEPQIYAEGDGTIRLGVSFDGSTTRAESVPAINSIEVANSAGVIRSWKSLDEIPAELVLTSGSYTVSVDAGVSETGFDGAHYLGSKEFTVSAGSDESVEVVCTISSVLASVVFDQTVKDNLTDYSVTVAADAKNSVVFDAATEGKVAYFNPAKGDSDLEWSFVAVTADGTPVSAKGKIENIKAATEYRLNVKYNLRPLGDAVISVVLDEATEDMEDVFDIYARIEIKALDFAIGDLQQARPEPYTIRAKAPSTIVSLSVSSAIYGDEPVELLSPVEVEGVVVTKVSDIEYTVALGAEYVASLPYGVTDITFAVLDDKDNTTSATVSFLKAQMNAVSAWDVWATKTAVSANMPKIDKSVQFGYKVTNGDWTMVEAAYDQASSRYVANLSGLAPSTSYALGLFVGGVAMGDNVNITTEAAPQILNGDFESWHKSGNAWYPYAEGATAFWDTGNEGATTLGESWNITLSSEDPRPGSTGKLCARMQSAYPSLMSIGKFAAGNIYVGDYAGTNGTNGLVDFGQPFTARPTALRGWYKCNVGTINKTASGAPVTSGPDRYQIMICLTTGVHRVDTSNSSTFFNCKTDSKVVAWGEILGTESVGSWTEFTLPLTYVKEGVRPTHIIIVATASSYGDYFTGSTDSWMCVDDFELIY